MGMRFNHIFASMLAISSGLFLSACQTQSLIVSEVNAQDASHLAPASLDSSRMMQHLNALENIAKANAGNRAVATSGGQASAQYIVAQAKQAGLQAQQIPFENRSKKVGQNIIVEIKGQSKDTAVIVGAHYDSVTMGPGINDNGSGVALLLELMHHYAQQKTAPKHTLYLAFWDSEEEGIGGSSAFVKSLSAEQLKGIQAYINLDMVGTKNPTVQIADGDQSSIADLEQILKERGMAEAEYKPLIDSLRTIPHHAGDLALEQQLKTFFKAKGVTVKEDVSTLTASDTAPFLGKVPVASLILFNEQMKGDVLEFAPCYHQSCDTIEQVDPQSLTLAADAVLHLLDFLNNK